MISGFGGSTSSYHHHYFNTTHARDLPVPFNIAKVLHNLLYEDIGVEFDAKEKDLLDLLRFSFESLAKFEYESSKKEADLKSKIFSEPDNMDIKDEYQDIVLDRQHAHYDFKNLVVLMSDMLNREQFEKLLKFSNIAI